MALDGLETARHSLVELESWHRRVVMNSSSCLKSRIICCVRHPDSYIDLEVISILPWNMTLRKESHIILTLRCGMAGGLERRASRLSN